MNEICSSESLITVNQLHMSGGAHQAADVHRAVEYLKIVRWSISTFNSSHNNFSVTDSKKKENEGKNRTLEQSKDRASGSCNHMDWICFEIRLKTAGFYPTILLAHYKDIAAYFLSSSCSRLLTCSFHYSLVHIKG